MDRFDLIPDNDLFEIGFGIALLILFMLLMLYLFYNDRKNKKLNLNIDLKPFIRRFNLDVPQGHLLYAVSRWKRFLNVNRLFSDEYYYEMVIKEFLKHQQKRGVTKHELERQEREFNVVKNKIKFSHKIIHDSRDLKPGKPVKVRITDIGFFTGKIIHNDNEGIVLTMHHLNEIKHNTVKNSTVILYYWDDLENYEVHTKIKKVTKSKQNYLLLSHVSSMVKGTHPGGMGIETDFNAYFTHIFDLPEEVEIKTHILTGTIKSLSIVGAEIETRFKIDKGGIYLFEFHDKSRPHNRKLIHFTGRVEDYEQSKGIRRLYVTFLDISEINKHYIHNLILAKINQLIREEKPDAD